MTSVGGAFIPYRHSLSLLPHLSPNHLNTHQEGVFFSSLKTSLCEVFLFYMVTRSAGARLASVCLLVASRKLVTFGQTQTCQLLFRGRLRLQGPLG